MLNGLSSAVPVDQNALHVGDERIYADGEMADRIRRFSWEDTSLGAISGWSEILIFTVNMILESQFPMLLAWGPEMVVLYNDACIPLLWGKHPHALGQTARDCWSEAWHILEPKLTAVFERGEKLYFENELIPIFRDGTLTDFYWTYSYSPVRDADGVVRGILDVSHDVTAKLTLERERDAMAASLKNVLESTTDGLVVVDKQGRYTYVNEQAAKIVAQRPADMIGKTQWEMFPHTSETEFGRQYEVAVKTGLPRHFDSFYPEPLNAWIESHCYPSEQGVSIYFRDVTEQKETEKALRTSESRFRKLFESDLMGIAIPDRFGAFLESNDELLRMTGYSREDQDAGLVRWDTMTPPEYGDLDTAHIQEVSERGSCTPYEKEYIRKNGTRVPILCGYALLEGSEDKYIGFVLDLTEQKRAERELREREERFRILADSLPQLIWMTDRLGNNTYCNQRYFDFLGVSEADRASIPWLELIHPDDLAFTLRIWNHSVETGEPYLNEFRLRRKDGMFRYFLARAVPIRIDDAQIERWIGSLTDIHDQKLAERELHKREERFHALAESLPQLIWMANATGTTTYCNQRVFEYFGLPASETDIPLWAPRFHPDDVEHTFAAWRRSIELSEPYQVEYRLQRHDGVYRHFLARAVPLRDESGTVERWFGSCTDVHDRKLAEDALRQSEKLATASRLAASIAHEINNPLEGVTNLLYLALLDDSLSANTKSYLQTAEQELRRVAEITTQTLRFHKQLKNPAPTDICDIVDSVLALFGQRLAGKNILVNAEFDRGAVVTCFGDELRQVVANVVSNAVDAMPHGGVLRVRVKGTKSWAQERRHGVTIVIADSGHGIPPGVLEHIFEPFVSTKEATAIGLGLWVSEGIVRKHGGAIRVRSKAKGLVTGTVFAIFIPSAAMSE